MSFNLGDQGMSEDLYQKLRQDILGKNLPRPFDESIRDGSMTLKRFHDLCIERHMNKEDINALDDSLIRLWISPYIGLIRDRADKTRQKRRETYGTYTEDGV